MIFEPGDEALITELAKTCSVAQLAEKWDCTYRQMYNYVYRHNIKPVLWVRPSKKRKVSDTVNRIVELHQNGLSVTDIALQVKRSVQYVSVILKRSECNPVSMRQKEMIAKAKVAVADAKKHGESYHKLTCIYYGWSKAKSSYWLRESKKAPSK